jgi:hypothetical protein
MNTILRVLLAAALLSPVPIATAQEACKPGDSDIVNPDGSRLRIRTGCGEDGAPFFDFFSSARSGSAFVPALQAETADAEPPTGVYFEDLNKDGYREIVARGMCGAGPNCLGEIYRWNRKAQKLERFLSSGWADLDFVDGYLITTGRASCCSWEFGAYRWDRASGYGDDAGRDLSVEVASETLDDSDDEPIVRCTFSRKIEGEWRVVPPPSPAWLKFCETYGKTYHIEGPEDRD